MSIEIRDGTGSKKTAGVTATNRLKVQSVTKPTVSAESEDGGTAFVVSNRDFETITTTGTDTPILYIKNNSDTRNLHIYSIRTCGTQVQKWNLNRGITGGIVTSALTASVETLNLAKTTTNEIAAYSGIDAETFASTARLGHWINKIGHSEENFDGALILGPSNSICVSAELAIAGDVCVRVIAYYNSDEN